MKATLHGKDWIIGRNEVHHSDPVIHREIGEAVARIDYDRYWTGFKWSPNKGDAKKFSTQQEANGHIALNRRRMGR
jgi:hypothetical protein